MEQHSQRGGRLRIFIVNRRILISLILLVALIGLMSSNRFWQWIYPIGYTAEIQQAARAAHVDPLLVASVIRVESKFNTNDVSHAGAVGLMQLMPGTAQWIRVQMRQHGDQDPVLEGQLDLHNPRTNIRIGSWYIHYLMAAFHGNQTAAIAAYNAGPRRVSTWLKDGTWNGQLADVQQIPVGETRHFVDRVFYNYMLYKRIYGSDAAWKMPT
ncbi:lytic transglycosylase domain-containing protein [Alicyclobacillus herbarius]|uniref:lytic transglycosylase domain-containing protein n=1 Tax=Alicyclobacillus herbarius TaxID=122960 RepID=UPI00041F138D|nr:lytic transglycosylase domain-containing protein [Alicyclobacillus herbarius]